MTTVLSESNPKARKLYCCDASVWVLNCLDVCELTFTEKRHLVKARRNKFQIQPGDKYYKQVNIWMDEFNVFKAIPAMNDICIKYDLYQEA